MVGLYYCPLPYMTADLQWDEARLLAALEELVGAGYARYDYESQVMLVSDALVDDPPQNPNQVKGAVAVVRQLPPTPLQKTLIEIADKACPALATALRNRFDTVSQLLRKGFETVSEASTNPSETVSNTEPDSRTRFPVPVPGTREEPEKPPPDLTTQEREILKALEDLPGHPFRFETDLEFVRRWLIRFPTLDLLDEIDRCYTWWTGPKAPRNTAKANWRSRIRNWLQKQEEIRKERGARERAQISGPGTGLAPGRAAQAGGSRPPGYYDRLIAARDGAGEKARPPGVSDER